MSNMRQPVVSHIPGVWRGCDGLRQNAEPSGWPDLDIRLPGGGWPVGAVTELLHGIGGIGEFSLLMPAIARLTRAERRVALIAPPYIPHAHGLAGQGVHLNQLLWLRTDVAAEALWACEQVARSAVFGIVIAWTKIAWTNALSDRAVRRLQLGAESGNCAAFLYRPLTAAAERSPAALRLVLRHRKGGLSVEILKNRGGAPGMVSLDAGVPPRVA